MRKGIEDWKECRIDEEKIILNSFKRSKFQKFYFCLSIGAAAENVLSLKTSDLEKMIEVEKMLSHYRTS